MPLDLTNSRSINSPISIFPSNTLQSSCSFPPSFSFPLSFLLSLRSRASHKKIREFFEREEKERENLPVYHNASVLPTARPVGIFLFGDEVSFSFSFSLFFSFSLIPFQQERGEHKSQLSETAYPYAMFIIRNYYYNSSYLFADPVSGTSTHRHT